MQSKVLKKELSARESKQNLVLVRDDLKVQRNIKHSFKRYFSKLTHFFNY